MSNCSSFTADSSAFAASDKQVIFSVPSGNFGDLTVFSIDQDAASPMAHATVAFDHAIVTINFHFTL